METNKQSCGYGSAMAKFIISLAALVYIWKSLKGEPHVIGAVRKGKTFAGNLKDKITEAYKNTAEDNK